jgi:hypothetical protein
MGTLQRPAESASKDGPITYPVREPLFSSPAAIFGAISTWLGDLARLPSARHGFALARELRVSARRNNRHRRDERRDVPLLSAPISTLAVFQR